MEDIKPKLAEHDLVGLPDEHEQLRLKVSNKHPFRFTHLGFKKKWRHKMTQFMKNQKSAEKVLQKAGVANG